MDLNYEYIAAHISDYIENENFFDTIEIKDIEKIMKHSHLTVDQFNTLLKQSSSTISSRKLYTCTRKAHVTIQNNEDILSILKSVKKCMKFNIFDGAVDVLNQKDKELRNSTEEIKKLQGEINQKDNQLRNSTEEIKKLQGELNQMQNDAKENGSNSKEFLNKISELKDSGDFESVYRFLNELSSERNQKIMKISSIPELWKIKSKRHYNLLYAACRRGDLNLVKSLIECDINEEKLDDYNGLFSLALACDNLEIVKYLIYVGANIECKDDYGYTPLLLAATRDQLEMVKCLISAGANKGAKDNEGKTPLFYAKGKVRDYLISIGAR